MLISTYLWRHVIWSTTESACGLVTMNSFLAHTKVRDLNMTVGIQHHVVKLQVSAK